MSDTELEARGSDTAAADAETKRSNGAKRARLLGMIGLAKRAGRLVCGTDAVISAVSSAKKPQLVIAADDISERTKKQLSDTTQKAAKKIRLCAWISITAIILAAAMCALAVLWSR